MPRDVNEICLTCAYWNADSAQREEAARVQRTRSGIAPRYECRSQPPMVLPSAQSMWPSTLPYDWCGDWDAIE